VSRVSGAHLRGFKSGPTHQSCNSCWQSVEDLIDSEFEPSPEANVLLLVPFFDV